MTKKEFMCKLKRRLSVLSKVEADERLTFYSEMIDDRVEEGLTEDEAVLAIGEVDEIAAQISAEAMHLKNTFGIKGMFKPQDKTQTLLLILGAPLWLPLLLAALAVAASLYIVLWALVITLWAVELPFLIFSLLSKPLLFACKQATLLSGKLTKKSMTLLGLLFQRKE